MLNNWVLCTVKLRNNDKSVKCRFFVVPGDGPTVLRKSDIKLLSILKITCDVIGDPHESRKFDSQTIETSNSPGCRTNKTHRLRQMK